MCVLRLQDVGPSPVVALSTVSVYPEGTEAGFEYASTLGYDAVEIMVGVDQASQSFDQVRDLQQRYSLPISAIHAPCLLLTQRVWGTDHWHKLEMSAELAHEVGAPVVVVHPPFRWQREYARGFEEGIARLEAETGLVFAVENMYPWRAAIAGGRVQRDMQAYAPHWDPTTRDFAHTTLDVSHASTAHQDCVDLAKAMGDRLRHIHLTDGTGSARDEHLLPGRGTQPVVELLEYLVAEGFDGSIVLEVSTRRAGGQAAREIELAEALAFARLNLAAVEVPRP